MPPGPTRGSPTTPGSRPHHHSTFNKSRDPETPSKSLPVTPIRSTMHIIDSWDNDSDLTPLTSPLEPTQIPKGSQQQRPSSIPVKVTSRRLPPHFIDLDVWDVEKLGPYVWVLLDRRARVLEPEDVDDPVEQTRDRLWWPGKIVTSPLTKVPLKIRLFGTPIPGITGVEISKPCQLNVLSLEDTHQRTRFEAPTFINSVALAEDVQSSPKKKHKYDRTDLEDRWRIGVAELFLEREEEGSDVMPEVGTLGFVRFITSTPSPKKSMNRTPRRKGQVKGKRKRDDHSPVSDEVNSWSPPPPDEMLQIPGELVLALEKASSTTYWPAKILQYIPPTRSTQQGKYRVEFLDTKMGNITRRMFYTTEEDQFATCKLGIWESEFNEVVNDDDNDNAHVNDDTAFSRSSSPIPSIPLPEPQTFLQLDIREQFVYTKPVLIAILNAEYGPAKRRHDQYIGGGQGRKNVVDEAGLRGRMDPRDVVDLEKYLSEWCLRDERRARMFTKGNCTANWEHLNSSTVALSRRDRSSSPTGTELASVLSQNDFPPDSFSSLQEEHLPTSFEVLSSSDSLQDSPGPTAMGCMNASCDYAPPPRQRGCEAYEALARVEKVDYCLNVLLPEAILQILLWRNGLRRSVDLLSEEEENMLHCKGEELVKERDWVNDIMRLRASVIRRLKHAQSRNEDVNIFSLSDKEEMWTITGRPKRNIAVPKSYQE